MAYGDEVGLQQWSLSEANGDNPFIFNIGPATGGAPLTDPGVVYQNEAGADSPIASVVYLNSGPCPTMQIAGTSLNLDQLDALEEWAKARVPLLLTDDLGREFQVYPVKMDSNRKHEVTHWERHQWTMDFLILDGLLDGEIWATFV